MKEIRIAQTLALKRKEKGVTQEELASHIGVTKASVSKWETGQSYPDITFLPRLAAYFDISIDTLLDYQPQLTREEIAALYHRLSDDFATSPFDGVIGDVERIVKQYFSCHPLLYWMGMLLINHHMLAGSTKESSRLVMWAKDLFVRVKTESGEAELANQALHMEAMCLLLLGRPREVLSALDGIEVEVNSTETLCASAYQMLGQGEKAMSALQAGLYKYLLSTIDLLIQYLSLCASDPARFASVYRRTATLLDTFAIGELNPSLWLKFHYAAACAFAALGDTGQALDHVQAYVDTATGGMFPLTLHGDAFFDKIDDWLGALSPSPPRHKKTIQNGMVDALQTPALASLSGQARFTQLIETLKNGIKEA